MTVNSEINRTDASLDWQQMGFYATSVVFNFCLIAQILTVGVAYFHNPEWWHIHIWLVRGYSGLSLILLGWSFITPFPRRIQGLTTALPILLGLQFASIHLKSPFHLEILHPLIGFTLFYVSSSLVHNVWRILSSVNHLNEQV